MGVGTMRLLPEKASAPRGFTRVELLCLVLAICALGLVRLAADASSKGKSSTAVCLYNLRQLTRAWQMYADDNRGVLPENSVDAQNVWVRGLIDYTSPESGNPVNLTNTPFGRYAARPEIYRCPADESSIRTVSGLTLRNRSYSMNAAVGSATGFWLPSPKYRTYTNLASITAPPPSNLYIFLEEHPDSINDGLFALEMPTSAGSTRLIDFPAAYHDGSMSLSYADGHSEMKTWVDARTSPPVRFQPILVNTSQANNADILWLAQRTSALAN
jgi:hypothetical protein